MQRDRGRERLREPSGRTDERDHPGVDVATERGRERLDEEERWVPVILKRTEEAVRHPDDILAAAIREGLEQLERPSLSLALSALAGGLILGFSALAGAVVMAAAEGLSPPVQRLATALVYPLGFVLCLMSGAELYTEHTATAVYPVLDRKAGFPALLRLWGVVAAGNLVGALASAWLLVLADPVVDARAGYVELGRHLVEPATTHLLVSSLLAGWLMALGAWLILATPPTISQVANIYIVTFLIGLGGLHHSIAGGVEMFAALAASEEFTLGQAARFLSVSLLGNLLGGSVFVALQWNPWCNRGASGADGGERPLRVGIRRP